MNIRLYTVDAEGRHGVVFIRLDAERRPAVILARSLMRQPYAWSRIAVDRVGDVWDVRPRDGAPGSAVAGSIRETVDRTPLEHWLTDRWGAHARIGRLTVWGPVRHPPWTMRGFDIEHVRAPVLPSLGLPAVGPPDIRALWSPGVRASLGMPVPLR